MRQAEVDLANSLKQVIIWLHPMRFYIYIFSVIVIEVDFLKRTCYNESDYPIGLSQGNQPHCYGTDDANEEGFRIANSFDAITQVSRSNQI